LPAVELRVPSCIPAEVDSPKNHSAAPEKAGGVLIIGVGDDDAPSAVTTSPWAMSESALISSMVTLAPGGTTMVGFTITLVRKFSAGMEGLARTTRWT